MVPRLILQFLGLPQIFLDSTPLSTDRRKAIALLAYLAVNDIGRPRQKYSREALSALLWPDYDQAKAFSNFRTTLWELRQAIGDGWLIAERETVHLNDTAEIDLDVARFRDLLSQAGQQNDPALRIPLLTDAVKLYRDHFLTGSSLKDAPNFNDWAFAESEDLRRKLLEALTMLSDDHCALAQAEQAIPYARRLVGLDPLNESSHRQLMEVYWQAGQHSAALKQYQTCEQILRKEMNLDPQPETRALYKKILKGEVKPFHIEKQVEKISSKHNLPTGTVTFLFTDIEGSTQLWEQAPEAMKTAHARHENIIREVVAAHGGYTYKMIGDAFQIAFATAPEALTAALDAQRALHAEPWAETGPIRVRMALHTGVTEERGDDYVGPVLNRVARLLGAGYGGQVLLTQATYDLVRDVLPKDAGLRDLGEHRLKDLMRPEHIYQLTAPDLPSDYPPLKTLGTFAHNLPAQVTSFIGREKEQKEIVDLIASHRRVTLTGAGGIGKTRLSIQTASALLSDFPNGTWLVELAPLSDPALVPQAIVTALGLIGQAGRSPIMTLTDFLQAKRALLVLDNCEHLIQACAQLAETLLRTCPDLHILTTSREALGVAGERLYLVPTLTNPDPGSATLDTLPQYEAVQLFVERAESVLASFMLTNENAPAVAQVCHQLDGIPLALELAAARIRMMSVEEIASHLNDRFHLLTGGARTALPRHQTLQAMIDWSHDLLSEPERVLLRRLSIFAGGWTLEAAESVCGGEDIQSHEILDLLTQLLNKSLILVKREQGRDTRYHMSETIRQYARDKLWAAREGERMRQRHLAYFVELAERAEPNLRAFDMVRWLDRLETELDNIRVALEWAQESDIEAQLRLASALLWFWHIRGHINEGVDWLERGLSIEVIERDDQPLTPSRAMIRGKALNASGFLSSGSIGKKTVHLEESLALFQQVGSAGKQGMAYALLYLPSLGKWAKGSKLERSLALFREIGDRFGAAECLMGLAVRARESGNFERAAILAEEHLTLRREIGDQDGSAIALAHLGDLAFMQQDYTRAITLIEQSLAIFREVRNKWGIDVGLSFYGIIFLWQGNYERATKIFEEAFVFAQESGDRVRIAFNFSILGAIAWFQGNYVRAAQTITDSLTVFRDEDSIPLFAAGNLHALGDIALAQGDQEGAVKRYQAELALGRETQNDIITAVALVGLGKVAWSQGDYGPATKRFNKALRISRETGPNLAMFQALYGLGRVAQSRGNDAAAHVFFSEALDVYRQPTSHPLVSMIWGWVSLRNYGAAVAYPLGALAVLNIAKDNVERAARLLGASEHSYNLIQFQYTPAERDEHDQAIAAARAALGEEAFAEAWAEGQAMTPEEAIAYALEDKG